jgi:hypothetical protein
LLALFSFIKSTIFKSFPFFSGTTIIGNNHAVSSIGSMNPIVTNLSISCLIANEFIVGDLNINEFIISEFD